jgi:hypothetical protein
LLGSELVAASDQLDFLTGARLVQFSDGVDEPAVAKLLALTRVHMPESRLATLLAAASFFDRAHRPLVEPYYETLISAFVRTANVSAIGNLLLQLPPGRALLAAIDAICLDRPRSGRGMAR